MAFTTQQVARWVFAGPVSFVNAILVMMGMAVWFPKGTAEVDNIVLPLLVFPLLWVIIFLYVALDRKLFRMVGVMLALLALHGVILAWHFAIIGGG